MRALPQGVLEFMLMRALLQGVSEFIGNDHFRMETCCINNGVTCCMLPLSSNAD